MNQVQSLLHQLNLEPLFIPSEDFEQLPGIFRRWELAHVIDEEDEYRISRAGELEDKTRVFFVYKRVQRSTVAELGVPVTLVFEAQRLAVRARVIRLDDNRPQYLAVTFEDAAAQARVHEIVARSRSLAELEDALEPECSATAEAGPPRDSPPR